MPITINGSGTVTGISAGGLPDDCITTAEIAAAAVTTAKIAAAAVTTAKLGTSEASGLAKAWVNFNGTGTVAIRASFNVSSITDNGTGDYTVNFTTALVDANYAFSALTGSTLGGTDQFGARVKAAPLAGSLNVASTYGNTFYDIPYFGISVFR